MDPILRHAAGRRVRQVEAAYLALLVLTFVAIAAGSVHVLIKLLVGRQ